MTGNHSFSSHLIETQAIEDGHFKFWNNRHSRYFVDFDRAMSAVGASGKITTLMYDYVKDLPVNVVLTPNPVHGYALATLLAARFNANPYRAERKGGVIALPDTLGIGPGANVLLVDDGLNTGNSMRQLIGAISDRNAKLLGICIAVDRLGVGQRDFGVPVYALADLSTVYPIVPAALCEECDKALQIEARLESMGLAAERDDLMKQKMRLVLRPAYVEER